jgi:alpha-amylase/alpha-mannosidase (GH57 family)
MQTLVAQDAALSERELDQMPVKFCVHGHFYQPPREDPDSGIIPVEPGAAPFTNYNEKITAECYRPNAELGNFDFMSFDLGPTLAAWLEQHHPDVYARIIVGDARHRQRYGVGNALAQVYNHTILPLASRRDKVTQIRWGLQDFHHRFGHGAHGMWLAETAVDLETLDLLAQHGITYTILAPWQLATPVDPTEPYFIRLHAGRTIAIFIYNDLSGAVSYDDSWTYDANDFARSYMHCYRNQQKEDQLHLIATDGELYGHHKPGRERYLRHLLRYSAPAFGFEVCTLERYLIEHPPTKEAWICEPSSWSCRYHGVARWDNGCSCTEGESRWKGALRQAMNRLNEHSAQIFEQYTREVLDDPWAARDAYLALRNGWETEASFWGRHGRGHSTPEAHLASATLTLLEAQYYHQYSFTSCGWFFEDLDRIEPANNIAFARKAIHLTREATGIDLQSGTISDLSRARSWRTGRTGADIYHQLPASPMNATSTPG